MPSGGVRGSIDAEASNVAGVIPGREQVSNGIEPERPWLANTRATRLCPPPGHASTARHLVDTPPIRRVGRSATMWSNHRQRLDQRQGFGPCGRTLAMRAEPAVDSIPEPATERQWIHGNSPAHPRTWRRLRLRVSLHRSRPGQARPNLGAIEQRCRVDRFIATAPLTPSGAPRHARFGPQYLSSRRRRHSAGAQPAAACLPFTHIGKDSA